MPLERWSTDSALSAAHLNQPVDALNQLVPLRATGGINVTSGAGGTVIEDLRGLMAGEIRQGHVTTTVGTGGSAYTDERYWVVPVALNQTDGTDERDQLTFADDPPARTSRGYAEPYPVTVTNLAEIVNHTHLLPNNHPVWYFRLWDRQDPRVEHWVMWMEPGVEVQAADGSDLVAAPITHLRAVVNGAGPDILEFAADTTGAKLQIKAPASTVTIGATNETEAAEGTAETDADTKTVNLVNCTRVAYNEAGDSKLYAYYRTLKFVRGILMEITAETRVEVDVPEAC